MKENLDFFKIQSNNMLPQRGRALIAEPFLQDTYFKRSVVLLTEHNEEGTLGFVINNPVDFRINEIIKGFPDVDCLVSLGGPVRTDTVHYLHTVGHLLPECEKVMESIYWGGDLEVLKKGLNDGWIQHYQVRFFVGYSSWYPGQLTREISENSWLVTEIDGLDVMHGTDFRLWEKVLNQEEERYQMWTRYPENPLWN